MSLVLSFVVEVVDSIAVGQHDTIVAPFVAQDIDEQTVAGATWLTLESLISTHHFAHIGFLYQSLEGWQVGLPQIAVGWFHIHRVAQWLWSAVYGIVFGTSVSLKVLIVVALHAQYGLHTQHGIHIGVLATSFLTTSPTRITEDIHIRTPESKFRIARVVNYTHGHVEQFRIVVVGAIPVGTSLIAHLRENIIEKLCIECCCHADRLRIDGVSTLTNTMTSLAPPVVAGNAQAVDGYRLVHHQSHLLLRSKQTQQILNTILVRQLSIQIRIFSLGKHTHPRHRHNG